MSSKTFAADEYDFIRKRMEELKRDQNPQLDSKTENPYFNRLGKPDFGFYQNPREWAGMSKHYNCLNTINGLIACYYNRTFDCTKAGKCLGNPFKKA